eukprot:CAMPEP_0201940742 /NCGR_PEP_ID=MMETSP0903-20130614/45759_1 /ASSEMBLY_ACC=CAM_ASM_000552 /TAXON_ID=420261 /ORGANISM="Thalassiosira antarctica, Strain CCMP982" /LENGTH=75 /DNA_ID=CAMNT_0048482617 /DNA_START=35 /DNA_END=262 /DNA_ORIENTATION=-
MDDGRCACLVDGLPLLAMLFASATNDSSGLTEDAVSSWVKVIVAMVPILPIIGSFGVRAEAVGRNKSSSLSSSEE